MKLSLSLIIFILLSSCSHKDDIHEFPPEPTPTPTPVVIDLKEVKDCQGATVKGPIQVFNKNGYVIRNCKIVGADTIDGDTIGIDVRDSENVLIENNHFSKIGNEKTAQGHCVRVFDSSRVDIKNNVAEGNFMGRSECISHHGTDSEISGNTLIGNTNIGIDALGAEGNGLGSRLKIIGNIIKDQKNGKRHAAGIYCDCCKDSVIEGNTVDNAELGIEVSCEIKKHMAENVKVMGNTIKNSRVIGLKVGAGYGVKGCLLYDNNIAENKKPYVDEGNSDCVAPK